MRKPAAEVFAPLSVGAGPCPPHLRDEHGEKNGRIMGLKVIGAGYGRTGTLSTYTALNKLGFTCYHMTEVLRNKANKNPLDFWRGVANTPAGTQHDWETVFADYSAAVDNPACCVWRELMAAYPDAKVLLTLHPRGAEAWYQSTLDTIYFAETRWQFKFMELCTPLGRKFADMSRKLVWQRNLGNSMPDRAKATAEYQRHIAEVEATVPPEKLLVYSVDQGWEPLCRFLAVPVPQTPFPMVNDRAEAKKTIGDLTMAANGILAAGALAVFVAVYGLMSLIGL